MGNQVSDWWNTTQPAAVAAGATVKVEWGQNNRHYKRAFAILALASPSVFTTGDVCRMMRLKANDRISGMFISSAGDSTVTTVDVGLYLPGTNLNGAVIDADEFAAASAVNGNLNKSEILLAAGATVVARRGAPLWSVAGYASFDAAIAAGAGEMDICLTGVGAVTTADEPVLLELEGSFS